LISEEGITHISGWKQEEEALRSCLLTQLGDLRSSVIKETCRLIVILSEALGGKFEETFIFVIQSLFKLLYITIKCMRDASDECVQAVLIKTHTPKLVNQFLLATKDQHNVVRQKSLEYLSLYLTYSDKDRTVELPLILEAVKKLIADSDKDVRVASRLLFATIEEFWPEKAKPVYEEMEPKTQKAIQDYRKEIASRGKGKRKL